MRVSDQVTQTGRRLRLLTSQSLTLKAALRRSESRSERLKAHQQHYQYILRLMALDSFQTAERERSRYEAIYQERMLVSDWPDAGLVSEADE